MQLLYSPTAEEARLVRKEINNNYSTKAEESVQQLKDWMQAQPHLPRNYGKDDSEAEGSEGCRLEGGQRARSKVNKDPYFT